MREEINSLNNISISEKRKKKNKVLIVGAGMCGRIVLHDIKVNDKFLYDICGFIDDDIMKKDSFVDGVKVFGGRDVLASIIERYMIETVIIAIPSASSYVKKEFIKICSELDVRIKIMPNVTELLGEEVNANKIRDIDIKDLLARDEVKFDSKGIKEYIESKVVLVTGGGGSIGSELCRQIVRYRPKRLVILDIYENNAYEIQNELKTKYPSIEQITLIGSVRDRKRMDWVMKTYRPNVVFHAAAHKHVPLMEDSPLESIKNNIGGTFNTVDLAYKYNVEKFVLISTDKAVNPTNVMGATKRYCEMILQGAQKRANDENRKCEFVAVRFGNVLGSNGSVVPLFKKQIAKGGPVTLTHKDITRYFMLIPEAVQLVLQAGAFAKGGEIFVLDMGEPVKIYDLAENLISLSGFRPNIDIMIEEVGLRPGEKLYEELLMDEEGLIETGNDKIFIAKPAVFDIEELKRKFVDLIEIGETGTVNSLKLKLQEIVPTYNIETIDLVPISEEIY